MTLPPLLSPSACSALVVVLLIGLFLPTVSRAQQTAGSQRPFRGLFGGTAGSSDRPQTLDFSGSIFAGYDDDLFRRGSSGPGRGRPRVGGGFTGAQASVRYAKRYPTATFSAGGVSSLRWLPQTGQFVPTVYGGSVGFGKQLGPRTSVSIRQGASYRPRLVLAPFSSGSTLGSSFADDVDEVDTGAEELAGEGPPDDFAIIANRNAIIYAGQATLSRSITSRSNLSAFGGYSVTDFRSDDFQRLGNRRYRAGARYGYSLTDDLSARLGYAYRTFGTRDGQTTDRHDIDVGLNYGRPFAIGFGQNRTRLTFTTGTSAAVRERLNADGTRRGGRRLVLRATGTATLRHSFVAPWQAQLQYQRGVGVVDGFTDFYSGDRVTASLAGLIGRRTDVLASLGYVSGSMGLRERNFTTTLGTVRARFALSQTTGLFAQYFLYQYEYTSSIADQLGVPPTLERQGVRAGLTVWLPLLR